MGTMFALIKRANRFVSSPRSEHAAKRQESRLKRTMNRRQGSRLALSPGRTVDAMMVVGEEEK